MLRAALVEGSMYRMLGMSSEAAGQSGMESDEDTPVVTPVDDGTHDNNDDGSEAGIDSAGRFGQLDSGIGLLHCYDCVHHCTLMLVFFCLGSNSSLASYSVYECSGGAPKLQRQSGSIDAGASGLVVQQKPHNSPGEIRDGSWEDAHATYDRFPEDVAPPPALPVSTEIDVKPDPTELLLADTATAADTVL